MTTAMSEALDNLDLLEETYRSIADIPPPPLPERPKLVSKNNSPVTVNRSEEHTSELQSH